MIHHQLLGWGAFLAKTPEPNANIMPRVSARFRRKKETDLSLSLTLYLTLVSWFAWSF
jgi:hypothetical protein